VVAVNSPDFEDNGIHQKGTKSNSIGRPLPGVAVRLIDPDTGERKKTGETGLLIVRGPNIMQGYLLNPELTAEVIHYGWYYTGDLAWMDADGFLHIADRLSRFSKIAGEMVPHLRIEEALQEALASPERRFVVSSVADERRGERIIVLHTASGDELEAAFANLSELPPLWRPKRDDFISVDSLPLLGSGKLDLCQAKRIAKSAVLN
jgi:acyl-[acyl-carrier-protein]-phospholipid O-acyltransferase/long-chain-fatty-acid--[acyl-carrier-protein] ligase